MDSASAAGMRTVSAARNALHCPPTDRPTTRGCTRRPRARASRRSRSPHRRPFTPLAPFAPLGTVAHADHGPAYNDSARAKTVHPIRSSAPVALRAPAYKYIQHCGDTMRRARARFVPPGPRESANGRLANRAHGCGPYHGRVERWPCPASPGAPACAGAGRQSWQPGQRRPAAPAHRGPPRCDVPRRRSSECQTSRRISCCC